MKLTIVTAYYNRRKLFSNTLKSISESKHKNDIEIIVVDDASKDNERIDDFPNMFDLNIKVIRIDEQNKHWINPCIPFNIGFKEAHSDVIILQNPECIHYGDVIDYTLNNIDKNLYLNYAAYSIDNNNVNKINNLENVTIKDITNIINPLKNEPTILDGVNGWYNHSIYKPVKLHFCSAIMKSDLDDLGGFDERFANGIAYDDNEFLLRIKRKNMKIQMIDKPFVIHQYHGNTDNSNISLVQRNALLYKNLLNRRL